MCASAPAKVFSTAFGRELHGLFPAVGQIMAGRETGLHKNFLKYKQKLLQSQPRLEIAPNVRGTRSFTRSLFADKRLASTSLIPFTRPGRLQFVAGRRRTGFRVAAPYPGSSAIRTINRDAITARSHTGSNEYAAHSSRGKGFRISKN